MANIIIKHKDGAAGAPAVGDLVLGELALNTYTGTLYTLKDDGTTSIIEIGGNLGSDVYMGTHDASGADPVATKKGEYWKITTAGTVGGTAVLVGDYVTWTGTDWNIIRDAESYVNSLKGQNNGLAELDSNGKVPMSQIPDSLIGGMTYQGTWDASTGNPPTTTPEKGWYYVVNVAGNTDLDGITDWNVGDWAVYNGTAWEKIDNTQESVTASAVGYDTTTVKHIDTADTNVQAALQKLDSNVKFWNGTSTPTSSAPANAATGDMYLKYNDTDSTQSGLYQKMSDGSWNLLVSGTAAVDKFTDLSDTPNDYVVTSGTAISGIVGVNDAGTALVYTDTIDGGNYS